MPFLPVALIFLLFAGSCTSPEHAPPRTAAPGTPEPWFEEVARARGLAFTHRSGHGERYLLPEIMGGGAALFDMDGDGDLDAYLVQSGSVQQPADKGEGNRLFRNRGNGTFEDATAGSGAQAPGYGMGAAAGDYDNDGDVDLYVTNLGGNVLLQNDGTGRFTDTTSRAGVSGGGWSTSAAFLDYDADGDLDLFVARYIDWSAAGERQCFSLTGVPDYCSPRNYDAPTHDLLYRNDGNGTFTDVTAAAGLRAAAGNGLGAIVADFDQDGRPDIAVANDGTPNHLWMNVGNGRFEERGLLSGMALDQDGRAKAGMGIHAADVDGDADEDLLIVNLDGESDSFFRNEKSYFVDDTAAVGLRTISRPLTRFGMAFADFNNDGLLDLYEANGRVGLQSERYSNDPYAEPNVLLKGLAGGRFEAVASAGLREPLAATSRAAAFGDLDNDGGVDVLVSNRDAPAHLLRNIAARRGHWLTLRVVDEHGRDALGAEVIITAAGGRVHRTVRAAYSYMASNDPRVHVGLGGATRVDRVDVRWPGTREPETFGPLNADRVITIRRATGRSAR